MEVNLADVIAIYVNDRWVSIMSCAIVDVELGRVLDDPKLVNPFHVHRTLDDWLCVTTHENEEYYFPVTAITGISVRPPSGG